MKGKLTVVLLVVLSLLLIISASILSLSLWLPRLAGIWLPAGVHLQTKGALRPGLRSLRLPDISLHTAGCEIMDISGLSAGYRQQMWQLTATTVRVDSECLATVSATSSSSAPSKSLADWQHLLPDSRLHIDSLQILPWQQYAGSVTVTQQQGRQRLSIRGDNLQLDADLNQQQLYLRQLKFTAPGLPQPVTMQGKVTLSPQTSGWPLAGELTGQFSLDQSPFVVATHWQQQRGELRLTASSYPRPILTLPWEVTPQSVTVHQGQWWWPFNGQVLQGGIALTADNWPSGLENTAFSGRLNVLTAGYGGKGNAVLSFGPGKLSLQQSDMPLRLTGSAGSPQLQFFASLPARLTGPLIQPEVRFISGALLRMRGRILDTLQVDEARFPLAGVSLSVGGVSGPLQAILRVHNPFYGQYRLQLQGQAQQFWPDNGRWNWRYWGNGYFRPLQAEWDIQGRGQWADRLITLQSLSTGLRRIKYAGITTRAARITLSKPVRWSRDPADPQFTAALLLNAGQTRFAYGGRLPAARLPFTLQGSSPENFLYKAQLEAGAIGPLTLNGRWDGERVRGQIWWPSQPLQVFQPLMAEDTQMKLTGGSLRAQAAFSASATEGFQAGGHWVITDGSLWTPDNQVSGVDFSLPFRYRQQRWQFGYRQPVRLSVGNITNQIQMKDITASVQGYYPWSENRPLSLSDVSISLLDGQLSLSQLRLPQHQPAILKASNISLSRLITALHPKQVAMSGRIDGELPLLVSDPQYIVRNGWIKNRGPLTLRVDKDLIDSVTSNNMAAGVAIDWLRYMEISRSEATLNVQSNGELTLTSKVQGTSRFSNKDQRVNLNYTHRENLFLLWKSLSFGDNLQSLLSQQLILPGNNRLKEPSE